MMSLSPAEPWHHLDVLLALTHTQKPARETLSPWVTGNDPRSGEFGGRARHIGQAERAARVRQHLFRRFLLVEPVAGALDRLP